MISRALLRVLSLAVWAAVAAVVSNPASAQTTGTKATGTIRSDTTVAPRPVAVASRIPSRLAPPLSPVRAFLYSAALPGFGQSRLDRGTSGALFASVELAALAMVRRSNADLREARRYRIDTLPSDFSVGGTTLVKSGTFTNRYTGDLVKTRRLHVEDWVAAMAFNHLFSGADAFVAAQLWDVPVSLSATPRADGALLAVSIRW
jgi:hypothetical protein